MASGSLFHSVGEATAKLHYSERLFSLDEETDRRLQRVRSLRLIIEERYGGWLKLMALLVRRLYLTIYDNEWGASLVCAGGV